MIVPGYFEDLAVLHENTLPVRSYYVPSSGKSEAPADQPLREASGRLRMLSGCGWRFRYYGSIYDLKEEFFRTGFTPDENWRREQVPFCWQLRGYDENQYTNIRYPFPFDPPFVPRQDPCGAYLHQFEVKNAPQQLTLWDMK